MARSMSAPAGLPATVGELRQSGWRSRSVKEEMRANLVGRLAAGRPVFEGIVGYDDSVIPSIDFCRKISSGEARFSKYDACAIGCVIFCVAKASANIASSASPIAFARH